MNNETNILKTVFSAKLFAVKHVQKTLPDGSEKTYELIDIQNAVTILAIDADQDIYLVEQYRIGPDRPLLELPAGKIEPEEEPLEAARRELREEIGMDAAEIKSLGSFYMTPGYANEFMHCFLATGLYMSPLAPDADEFIHVRKIPKNQLFAMIDAGEIQDAKTLAVLILAKGYLES